MPQVWVPNKIDAPTVYAGNRIAPENETPTLEPQEKPSCDVCRVWWIAIGTAGGLVLTGGWVALVLLRK